MVIEINKYRKEARQLKKRESKKNFREFEKSKARLKNEILFSSKLLDWSKTSCLFINLGVISDCTTQKVEECSLFLIRNYVTLSIYQHYWLG